MVITLFRPGEGIWQTADQLVTTTAGGPIDRERPKHVRVVANDGTMLITFTGLAELAGGLQVADWIRESIRGANRTMAGHFAFLAERADRDITHGPVRLRREPLQIHGAGIAGLRPGLDSTTKFQVFMNMQNFEVLPDASCQTGVAFRDSASVAGPIRTPVCHVGGSGTAGLTSCARERLLRACTHRPNRPDDYRGLLAAVNRAAAQRVPSVSAWCTSIHVPESEGSISIVHHRERRDPPQQDHYFAPTVFLGMDLTEQFRAMHASLHRIARGEPNGADGPSDLAERMDQPRP